jgi:hypothetical protein
VLYLGWRFGWLTVASGGTTGALASQQSLCCHSLVAALNIAFGLAGSTGWWQFGQTNASPFDDRGMRGSRSWSYEDVRASCEVM